MQLEAHIDMMSRLAAGAALPPDIEPLLEPGSDVGMRPAVYRNSGMLACVDALRSNYRGLAHWLGDARFAALARAFADAAPPATRTLVGWGADLPDWMAADAEQIGEPWLVDIARLDRAWVTAHLAADGDSVDPTSLVEVSADEIMGARLVLRPGASLVVSRFELYELWHVARDGRPLPQRVALTQGAEFVLVWRPDMEVESRLVSAAEHAFLRAVLDGRALGEAAGEALAVDAIADVSALFAAILAAKLVTDIVLPIEQGNEP